MKLFVPIPILSSKRLRRTAEALDGSCAADICSAAMPKKLDAAGALATWSGSTHVTSFHPSLTRVGFSRSIPMQGVAAP